METLHNEPIEKHTTFGVKASANVFINYQNEAELRDILAHKDSLPSPLFAIGTGANLLFVNDFKGTLLHSQIKGIEVTSEKDDCIHLRVGAGEIWDDFVSYCVKNDLYGAENLSLIPSSVGATAVQNIGAYGMEAKDLIVNVECMDQNGDMHLMSNEQCCFGYRDSAFKRYWENQFIITRVTYRLWKQPHWHLDYGSIRGELADRPLTLNNVRETIIKIRTAKLPDPKVTGNAGSFFKNPVVDASTFDAINKSHGENAPHYDLPDGNVKIPAAWLIDQCGWKGKQLGNAAVHDKQPLVLVNAGNASGLEVKNLCNAIRSDVYKEFGIDLHPEVIFIENETNTTL